MSLVVVVVYPDLLGTYGDGGNGVVLARRAAWRGIPVELVAAASDQPLPAGDLYCLGGGEDGPQVQAAEMLLADGGLVRAVEDGAVVLAVCAGYQIVGTTFPGVAGRAHPGVGLLDVSTVKGGRRRAVGEVLADPFEPGLPPLTGFENHGGVTTLGPGVHPLGRVRVGVGNGTGDGGGPTEGGWAGRVVGTYLHGPVLARNPALADLLLGWAVSDPGEGEPGLGRRLPPLDDREEEALRGERVASVRRGGWLARFRPA